MEKNDLQSEIISINKMTCLSFQEKQMRIQNIFKKYSSFQNESDDEQKNIK